MTALRRQAVQLVQQVPEDQMPNIIQYLHSLIGKVGIDRPHGGNTNISSKLKAFWDLEQMVKPVPELDYEKELEEARTEKYGHFD